MLRADDTNRERYMRGLYTVTGSAKFCAPCAWSALTGWSSDTWRDDPMTDNAEHYALDKLRWDNELPWYLDEMPDRLVGLGLDAFREPGRWALTVEWDGDDDRHAVAVAVDGSTRVFADNHIREPLPVETLLERHEVYRTAVIVFGLQLVPSPPLRLERDGA